MANTLEMRQQRERLIYQMGDAIKEANAADETRRAELLAIFDKAEAEERALHELIRRNEAHEALQREALAAELEKRERTADAPKGRDAESDYSAAFRSWFTNGTATPEELQVLSTRSVKGGPETRGTNAQVVGTANLGGYLVPTGFWPMITKALADYSGIYSAAQILTTSSGNTLYKPTLDDTSTSAVLVAESASFTVADLTFGQKQLDAYKYGTLLKTSWELMHDAEFDIESEIRSAMMPRFGRALNTSATTGSGSSQPNGVVTASSLGKTAASATAITRSEIVDLIHSVDPAYRASAKCGFMMHDNVLAAIKKLVLGSGDASPLWQRSMREGEPDTIEGYKFWINQAMASALTTGLKVMLFGDFDQFVIRMVKALEVSRLNELYAANGQTGFIGHMRWDSECLNTAAIKHYILA